MSDPGSIDSPRVPLVPSREVESWPGRILSWIYPSRGWGDTLAQQVPGGNGVGKTRPTPGRPAGFQTGETR